jgi:GMP synthase-like glutamine amidotransferase
LANESHCGELAYLPAGWTQIGGPGSGTSTNLQCFRKNDRYIYGAQFHIENDYNSETNSNAVQIMTNFLGLAQQWGGYQPNQ